jgi:hypothetical protein
MTEKNKITTETEKTTNTADVVQKINEMSPRNLQADAVVCPCEDDHRAVYPVRYAYSNFYWDLRFDNSADDPNRFFEATLPPAINHLLNAKTMGETKGFSARLLREGWIYIFEEGEYNTRKLISSEEIEGQDPSKGRLLIFNHEVAISPKENSLDIEGTEYFTPYVFIPSKNGKISLQKNVSIVKNGCKKPYLPISKDVIEASILYSEVKLSNYTLKKIISEPEFRNELMQKVNFVDYDDNQYCIELNEDNLNRLVEDYKEESSKFKLFINDVTHTGVPSSFFSEASKVPDLPQDAIILQNQAKKTLDYEEKASLIILKDPIGYQKDILSYYNVITELYTLYLTYYSHPNKIGHYIKSMQVASDNIKDSDERNKMKKIIRESINQNAIDREWNEINRTFKFFDRHQKIVLSLYEGFINNPKIINKNGGIKHYFDHVFLLSERIDNHKFANVDFLKDLNKVFGLFSDLIVPLQNSDQGRITIERLYSISDEPSKNLWHSLTLKVIGLAAKKNLVNELIKVDEYPRKISDFINKISAVCYDVVAYSFAKTHSIFSNDKMKERIINVKGIEYLANKVLPMIAKFSNVTISFKEVTKLSGKELLAWNNKLKNILGGNINASDKLHKLFDWENRISIFGKDIITIPKFEIKDIKSNKIFIYGKEFTNVPTQVFLSGFGLIMSSIQIYSLQSMSLHNRNNPLKLASINLYFEQVLANLFISFSSIMKVGQVSAKLSTSVSSTTLKFFLDKIKIPILTTASGDSLMKGLGKIAGFMGAALAARDVYESFSIGNQKQSFYQSLIVVGSLLLTFITGGVWVTVGGLLVIGGFIGSQLTSWSHLETLLKHSFWGNEIKSNFWNNKRPEMIQQQLDKYIENFEFYNSMSIIELQEFNNLIYTARLIQEEIAEGNIKLSFEFNNFTPGISQVYFSLVTKVNKLDSHSNKILGNSYDYILQSGQHSLDFNQQLKEASENGVWDPNTGIYKFSIEVKPKLVYQNSLYSREPLSKIGIEDLYWYYQVNKELKTPLRYLEWSGEAKPTNSVVGFINSENL